MDTILSSEVTNWERLRRRLTLNSFRELGAAPSIALNWTTGQILVLYVTSDDAVIADSYLVALGDIITDILWVALHTTFSKWKCAKHPRAERHYSGSQCRKS